MIFVHIQSDLNFFVYLFLQVRKNKKKKKEISWNQGVESVHNKNTKTKEELYLMLSCQIIR